MDTGADVEQTRCQDNWSQAFAIATFSVDAAAPIWRGEPPIWAGIAKMTMGGPKLVEAKLRRCAADGERRYWVTKSIRVPIRSRRPLFSVRRLIGGRIEGPAAWGGASASGLGPALPASLRFALMRGRDAGSEEQSPSAPQRQPSVAWRRGLGKRANE